MLTNALKNLNVIINNNADLKIKFWWLTKCDDRCKVNNPDFDDDEEVNINDVRPKRTHH